MSNPANAERPTNEGESALGRRPFTGEVPEPFPPPPTVTPRFPDAQDLWKVNMSFGSVGVRVEVGCQMYYIEDRERAAALISMYVNDNSREGLVRFVTEQKRLPTSDEMLSIRKGGYKP